MVPIPGYARTVSAASIITLDEEHEKSGSPLVVFGEIERQYLVSETALSVLHRLPLGRSLAVCVGCSFLMGKAAVPKLLEKEWMPRAV